MRKVSALSFTARTSTFRHSWMSLILCCWRAALPPSCSKRKPKLKPKKGKLSKRCMINTQDCLPHQNWWLWSGSLPTNPNKIRGEPPGRRIKVHQERSQICPYPVRALLRNSLPRDGTKEARPKAYATAMEPSITTKAGSTVEIGWTARCTDAALSITLTEGSPTKGSGNATPSTARASSTTKPLKKWVFRSTTGTSISQKTSGYTIKVLLPMTTRTVQGCSCWPTDKNTKELSRTIWSKGRGLSFVETDRWSWASGRETDLLR